VKAGANKQTAPLLLYGRYHLLDTVPHILHPDSTCKVNVFFPLNILNDGAFGPLNKDWGYGKGRTGNMFLTQSNQFPISLFFMITLLSFLPQVKPFWVGTV